MIYRVAKYRQRSCSHPKWSGRLSVSAQPLWPSGSSYASGEQLDDDSARRTLFLHVFVQIYHTKLCHGILLVCAVGHLRTETALVSNLDTTKSKRGFTFAW